MATEAQRKKEARDALNKFCDKLSGDADEDDDYAITAEMVRAAGNCLLGIWDSVRRIADA